MIVTRGRTPCHIKPSAYAEGFLASKIKLHKGFGYMQGAELFSIDGNSDSCVMNILYEIMIVCVLHTDVIILYMHVIG